MNLQTLTWLSPYEITTLSFILKAQHLQKGFLYTNIIAQNWCIGKFIVHFTFFIFLPLGLLLISHIYNTRNIPKSWIYYWLLQWEFIISPVVKVGDFLKKKSYVYIYWHTSRTKCMSLFKSMTSFFFWCIVAYFVVFPPHNQPEQRNGVTLLLQENFRGFLSRLHHHHAQRATHASYHRTGTRHKLTTGYVSAKASHPPSSSVRTARVRRSWVK